MAGQHGGHRPGAGRPRGMTTKFAEEARALASPYAPRALRELAKLAGIIRNVPPAQSEQARVQALRESLDPAYGKPKQPVEGEMLQASVTSYVSSLQETLPFRDLSSALTMKT